MPKRSSKAMTERERQCQRASREKAQRRMVHACWLRVRWVVLGSAVVAAVAGGVWEYHAQGFTTRYARAVDRSWQLTANMGFEVNAIYLEGRARTPKSAVEQALSVPRGAPILRLSPAALQAQLERIPTVKHAAVERALPSSLHITLFEREPVARWQWQGNISLVDDEGVVMRDLVPERYVGLPLMVGKDAPDHVQELLALLEAEPSLKPMVRAAVRVGDRRWNMRMHSGVEVKLPETNAHAAWHQLATLQQEQNILARALTHIDLRLPDRLVLRMRPGAQPTPATMASARET